MSNISNEVDAGQAAKAAIEAYRGSDAHKQIQSHSRELQGAKAAVKRYSRVS